jgi:uncharacterized protein (DUF885 family)
MGDHVTSAREALMAELLEDVDTLIQRLERVHEALPGLIEQATKDAAGKAFLAARLNLETVIDQQAHKLTDAGHHSAALIGNQLNSGTGKFLAASGVFNREARRLILLLSFIALGAGALGGFIGAKLVGL